MNPEHARRDLALIEQVMASNRRVVVGTWRHQVWWGALTGMGMVATWWADAQGAWRGLAVLWPVLIAVGWLGSWHLGSRQAAAPVRNAVTRTFVGIWVAIGGALSLMGIAGIAGGGIAPTAFPGIAATLFGAGYLASARATGLDWLVGVALVWWMAALPLLAIPGRWSYLALALLLVVLQTGSGLALSREEVGRSSLVRAEVKP
jgi:hypothetical protein